MDGKVRDKEGEGKVGRIGRGRKGREDRKGKER